MSAMLPVVICGYFATNPDMEKNIGCKIRFNYNKRNGSLANECVHTIVGIQKIWNGQLAYRVTNDTFNDTFGRPALPNEISFVN